MKITVVNGQSHKGSTYHIGKMLADKLGGEVTEFFSAKGFWRYVHRLYRLFYKKRKALSAFFKT